jgi:hypothetical protein
MKGSRVRTWIDRYANFLFPFALMVLCTIDGWRAFYVWRHGPISQLLPSWTLGRGKIPTPVWSGSTLNFLVHFSLTLSIASLLFILWLNSVSAHNRRSLATIRYAQDSLDLNSRGNCLNVASIETAKPSARPMRRGAKSTPSRMLKSTRRRTGSKSIRKS